MTKTEKEKETMSSALIATSCLTWSPVVAVAMVIIAQYRLIVNMLKQIICEVLENPVCPLCQETLKPRDSRWRIWCEEGHDVYHIKVRRLYCKHCRRLHTELPDCLSPYKHYTSETIEGVLDGVVTPHDEESESYPCEATMERWKQWLAHNYLFIEGFLRMIGFDILLLGEGFLRSTEKMLENIRKYYPTKSRSWLGFVNRVIYNSGASLEPFPKAEAP